MKHPMPKTTVVAVMMALYGISGQVIAEEGNQEDEQQGTDRQVLEKVVVQGILPDNLESVPGSYYVVDEKALEERRPFSVQEALNNVPGIHIVGENSFGLGLNIGIRGLDPRRSARTLVMEDGVPLYLAPYGDPSLHVTTPVERLQRIEVVKGSGQILYGPQTIGGMINFVTRPVPTDGFRGSVTAMAGNNDFRGGHVNLGYGDERGGLMIDALQKKGDGIRRGHDFDVRDITIKGQININEQHTVIGKIGYYEEDSAISETGLGAVSYAEDKFQAPTADNDEFKLRRKSFQLQHIFNISDDMKLSTNAFYVDTFRRSFRQINEPGENAGRERLDRCSPDNSNPFKNDLSNLNSCGGRHRPREFEFWGFEPRLDFSHNLFGLPSDAVIGMRYIGEDQNRKQFRPSVPEGRSFGFTKANIPSREDIDVKVQSFAYYAQNTFYVDNWSFTPGVRVEDYKVNTNVKRANDADVNWRLSNSQTEVLPGFGVAWNGIQNTTVFGGIHKGFGPPRPSRDLDDISDNTQNRLNATKFETSVNYEIGVRSNYFKGIAFETTLFHTKIDDIVIGADGFFGNAGKSEQTGLELAGRIDFGTIYNTSHNFYISGSYTNVFTAKFTKDAEFNGAELEKGNRLPYSPRDIASINFGYAHPVGLDARIGIDYVSKQFVDVENTRVENLAGNQGTIPSYTLLNATVNFRPVGSQMTYFLSAYNLADKEFLISRVDGKVAGRDRQVFGGVRYDF